MNDNDTWMIYGAYGYTGRLIVETAIARGHRPVLAGRDPQKLADLATRTGLPVRIFALGSQEAARRGVRGMRAVLHAAGPFSQTSAPMLEACMKEGAHYLDITGEIDVFESIHRLDAKIRAAGISAVPGVGFDVVPTDALAAVLKETLPDATHLTLAFKTFGGGLSPGTAKTMVEGAGFGGRIRQNGRIVVVPSAYKTRTIPYLSGEDLSVTIPWGDVSTAYYTTGIPNIETYVGVTARQLKSMRASVPLQWLMRPKVVQAILKANIQRRLPGPSLERRLRSHTEIYGEAVNAAGTVAKAALRTPEGYTLTAEASVRAVEQVLGGIPGPGAFTPAKAFGGAFACAIPGVELFA